MKSSSLFIMLAGIMIWITSLVWISRNPYDTFIIEELGREYVFKFNKQTGEHELIVP
jgi:hypothetical protein